ncbi:hypothetical protein ACHQM5_030802 [Ranunculus cassubicifolius]
MVSCSTKSIFLVILLVLLVQAFGEYSLSISEHFSQPCNGSIAECNEDDELLMDSEISRRLLQAKRPPPITYGALTRDQPAAGSGNTGRPYKKACIKIYRCRGG